MSRKQKRRYFEVLEPRCLLSGAGVSATASDLAVYIPTDINVAPGQIVTVPVKIKDANGLRSADITINYDTTLLDATDASISAVKAIDSVWPAGTPWSPNVDDATGTIVVTIFNSPAIGPGGGTLMTIDFTIKSTAQPGTQTKIDLERASLNEGQIAYSPTPQKGDDPTDGDITLVPPNHAPVLDPSANPTLTPINEDAANNPDNLVSEIIVDGSITDSDGPAAKAIAVVGVDNQHGHWQYATVANPAGGDWQDFTATTGSVVDISATARLLDAGQHVRFVPDANFNGSAQFTFRAWDKATGAAGGTADLSDPGVSTGGSTAFSTATDTAGVVINPVNDAPSFTKGLDQAVNEDAGAQTVPAWATNISAGPSDETGQTVAFQVSNDNNGLFTVQPAISPDGTLTYTPAANANGMATVTVLLKDNGGIANGGKDTSGPQTFEITVSPVNDPPLFIKGADQTVNEDAGAQTVPTWATNISAGPPDEAGQTLTLQLTADNTALFAVQPAIAANGTLTYTPAANANGVATVTVVLKDNGGVANGGKDSSAPQTFKITVNPVNDAPSGANKTVTTLEDTAYKFAAADFGFSDPNDTPPNAFLAVEISTLPGAGSLTDNGTAVTAGQFVPVTDINAGTLVFTPASNASGNPYASFTFQVQDDGGTANSGKDTDPTPRTLTINATSVNDPPSGADKTVTTLEDTAYKFVAADFGFSDPNDTPPNALLGVKVSPPTAGSLTDNGVAVTAGQLIPVTDINAGNLLFTPAANANGSPCATFTFQVQDDGGIANGGQDTDPTPRTMAVNVTSVNDAPQITVPGAQSVASNTDKVISGISAQDVDAGAESIQMTLSVLHGKLTVKDSVVGGVPPSGVVINPDGKQVMLTASVTQINATLADAQGLTYRGDQDYIGPETLTVLANDLGPGPDGAKTDTKTVAIAVGQTAGIGGYAYADANRNNGPDNDIGKHQWEGIPGVLITLTDQAGKSWTTWTDDAGWYYFDNLPAGTDQSPVHYQITERQPSALVDGGANAIPDVPLKGGRDITDQCFRELSLKPRYTYNRLLATSSLPVGSAQWKQVIWQIIVQAEKDAGVTPLPPSPVTHQTNSAGHALVAAPAVAVSQARSPVQVPSSVVVSPPAAIRSPVATTASAPRTVSLVGQQQPVAKASAGTATSASASKPNSNPLAASQPAAPLTTDELKPIVNEAIADWAKAGLPAVALDKLRTVTVSIADLSNSKLGWTENNQVLIDRNAAGYGWFVDSTPTRDEEFQPTQTGGQLPAVDPRALTHMDLLTVVEHELGHILGLDDDIASSSYDLLSGTLTTGIRRKVNAADIDAVLAVYGSSSWV